MTTPDFIIIFCFIILVSIILYVCIKPRKQVEEVKERFNGRIIDQIDILELTSNKVFCYLTSNNFGLWYVDEEGISIRQLTKNNYENFELVGWFQDNKYSIVRIHWKDYKNEEQEPKNNTRMAEDESKAV